MHIQTQICGLAIMAALLFLFLRQKRVGLYTEKVFIRTILIAMVCVTLDFLSVIAITNMGKITFLQLEVICKSYIISIVWVGYIAFTYIITDMYNELQYKKKQRVTTLIALVESCIIAVLPIKYYRDGFEVYTYGLSVVFTYLFALLFILATIYMELRHREQIEAKRRLAVGTWLGFWLAAAAVQFFNNELLLVGFAIALGLLTLYCTLENPENYIDHKFGCFHQHVFVEYMNQCYGRNENVSVMFISFLKDKNVLLNNLYVEDCLKVLIKWFEKNTKAKVFRSVEQELAIVFPNHSVMMDVFARVQETFYSKHFFLIKKQTKGMDNVEFPPSLFILFEESLMVATTEEMMEVRRLFVAENIDATSSMVCHVDEEVLKKARYKSEIISEINAAMDEDRVEIFLQPIYSVEEKKFVSAEVLARIRNKNGSVMPPGVFIPVAEKNGLIDKLGERVFKKTCRFLQKHSIKELGIHYLEVNLSVVQCEQHNLSEHYMDIMHEYDIEPYWINLEITETGSVQSRKTLMDNMNKLIAQGVSFSLDDFGNDQSNLDYMIDMPVSVIKLDMNMSQAYFKDLKAKVIVQAIVKMAHELDLRIVAEGIETKEQFEEMVRLGVDYIQGYYFSKPLSEMDYIKFIYTNTIDENV